MSEKNIQHKTITGDCRQCGNCTAISVDCQAIAKPENGKVVINERLCNHCEKCSEQCKRSAIKVLSFETGNKHKWLDIVPEKTKYSWLNMPSGNLRIAITDECNMKCYYCHAEGMHDKGELPANDIIRIIEGSMKYGLKDVRFSGGEPTLHPELVSICKHLNEKYPTLCLGINTNCMDIDRIMKLITETKVTVIAAGIDYADKSVSKQSAVGLPSKKILENVLRMFEVVSETSITMVYDGDLDNAFRMIEWCKANKIFLKILEKVDCKVASTPTNEYQEMVKAVIKKFDLQLRYNGTKQRYYGVFRNGGKKGGGVYFFTSHCRMRECVLCRDRYFKVDNKGWTQSCLFDGTPQFSLMDIENFDNNFKAALAYIAIPPENYNGGDIIW
jgi:molybdenum cofactor biosynthesis enzyme MoaA